MSRDNFEVDAWELPQDEELHREASVARPEDVRRPRVQWRKTLMFALGATLFVAYPLLITDEFAQHVAIMVLMFATIGQAWNILGGYAGQISLGHSVFFGLGAYTTAVLQTKYDIPPVVGIFVAALLVALVCLILGPMLFRFSGHIFVIATLVLSQIFLLVFQGWEYVNAAAGVILPVRPGWVHLNWGSKVPYYYFVLCLAAIAFGVTWWISKSRFGYYFRAIGSSESMALAVGVSVSAQKVLALVISGSITALAGAFSADYVLYITPDSVFGWNIVILAALVPMVGGVGTLWGPFLGAVILVPMIEYSRVLLGSSGSALNIMAYGLLLVIIAVFEPGGIASILNRIKRKWWSRGRSTRG